MQSRYLVAITLGTLTGEAAQGSQHGGLALLRLRFRDILCRMRFKKLRKSRFGYRRSDRGRDIVFLVEINFAHQYNILSTHNERAFGNIAIAVPDKNAFDRILQDKIRCVSLDQRTKLIIRPQDTDELTSITENNNHLF